LEAAVNKRFTLHVPSLLNAAFVYDHISLYKHTVYMDQL